MQFNHSVGDTVTVAESFIAGLDFCDIARRHTDRSVTPEQLRQKLTKLDALLQRMKAINSLVRNRNIKALRLLGYSASQIQRMLEPVCGRQAAVFPEYKLRSSFDKVRKLRLQLKELEAAAQRCDVEIHAESYTYLEDASNNKIMFRFHAKPVKAMRAELRKYGFVRSSWDLYARHLSAAGRRASQQLRNTLDRLN